LEDAKPPMLRNEFTQCKVDRLALGPGPSQPLCLGHDLVV
jgi:hypothetical protein